MTLSTKGLHCQPVAAAASPFKIGHCDMFRSSLAHLVIIRGIEWLHSSTTEQVDNMLEGGKDIDELRKAGEGEGETDKEVL